MKSLQTPSVVIIVDWSLHLAQSLYPNAYETFRHHDSAALCPSRFRGCPNPRADSRDQIGARCGREAIRKHRKAARGEEDEGRFRPACPNFYYINTDGKKLRDKEDFEKFLNNQLPSSTKVIEVQALVRDVSVKADARSATATVVYLVRGQVHMGAPQRATS